MHRLWNLLFAAVMSSLFLPVSFAQEVDLHKEFMIKLGDQGDGKAVLGIYLESADGEKALITDTVKEGPAAKAGLKAGDIILKINGKSIGGTEVLMDVMKSVKAGDRVTVLVSRDGTRKKFAFETGGYEDVFENGEMVVEEIIEQEEEHGGHAVGIPLDFPKAGRIQIGDEIMEIEESNEDPVIIKRGIPQSGRFFQFDVDEEEEEGEGCHVRILKTEDGKEIMLVAPRGAGMGLHRLESDGEDEDEDVQIIETDGGKRIVIRKKSDAPVSAGKAQGGMHVFSFDMDEKVEDLHQDGEHVETRTFTFPGGKGVIQIKVCGDRDGECCGTCEIECSGTCGNACGGSCQAACSGACGMCTGGEGEFNEDFIVQRLGNKRFAWKAEPEKKVKKNRKAQRRKAAWKRRQNPRLGILRSLLREPVRPVAPPCHCCPECRLKHNCCNHLQGHGGRAIRRQLP